MYRGKNATTKETDESNESWRDKWCRDGVWLKWTVERLETQKQLDCYNELKDRLHNNLGYTELSESCMLRFLTGLEFDIDTAEEHLSYHRNFMKDNDMYAISDDRVSNIKPLNVIVIYNEDKFERPVQYTRISRFIPGNFEYEELKDYWFYNIMNMRNAFKPHVESFISIYDVKGLSRKNFSLAFFKKIFPECEK